PGAMRRVFTYVHASSTRECFSYLALSFVLTWLVWIPVLLASRRHEQGGNLLVLGTFGPTVAAILLSYRGNRVPGSKLSSRSAQNYCSSCRQPFQLGSSQLPFHGMVGYEARCERS